MPITQTPYPILSQFFCSVVSQTGMPPQPLDATHEQKANAGLNDDLTPKDKGQDEKPKKLPKGVVLGKDGKPCRSCTSVASWMAMAKTQTTKPKTIDTSTPPAVSTSSLDQPADCPPDVEQLGRGSWALLHSIAAQYPERPSQSEQNDVRQFVSLFAKLYPCWVCGDEFKAWMSRGHAPKVSSRQEFARWLCDAHNDVNERLGKPIFDCNKWDERWRTGWKDGRCG